MNIKSDKMKLDDKALDNISSYIKKYCMEQKEIIREYYSEIRYLEEYWDGGNFDSLLDKVESLDNKTEDTMEEIGRQNISYFREKAEMIRNRPSFSGNNVSNKNSFNATSKAGGKTTNIDKTFAKYNKEIVNKISTYLKKNNIIIEKFNPEKISFYDPYGKSKNGLYKNIMSININSPTYKQDLIKLTGQHLFFKMRYEQQQNLIRTLAIELENKSNIDDIAYSDICKKIKSGIGIETKYLNFSSDNIKTTFNFFDNAFTTVALNDSNEIEKYKKYFPNSYKNFLEILNNLEGF